MHRAAAGHDTLVCLVVTVLAGAVILLPALVLLFRLTLAGRFRSAELVVPGNRPARGGNANTRALARLALAGLIAGIGLLNAADATWAHGLGIACLACFVALAFGAIPVPALDLDVPEPRALTATVAVSGVSHALTSTALRERLHLAPEGAAALACSLAGGRQEAVVLATCNRTELYLTGTDAADAGRRATAALAELAGGALLGSRLYTSSGSTRRGTCFA